MSIDPYKRAKRGHRITSIVIFDVESGRIEMMPEVDFIVHIGSQKKAETIITLVDDGRFFAIALSARFVLGLGHVAWCDN